MTKNYGVFEDGYGYSIDYLSGEDFYAFAPLNIYNLSMLDFTWYNVKFLAVL